MGGFLGPPPRKWFPFELQNGTGQIKGALEKRDSRSPCLGEAQHPQRRLILRPFDSRARGVFGLKSRGWGTIVLKKQLVVLFSQLKATVDGRNPVPPQRPWKDDSPANTNKQWFPMVSKWCRILSIHSRSMGPDSQTGDEVFFFWPIH